MQKAYFTVVTLTGKNERLSTKTLELIKTVTFF